MKLNEGGFSRTLALITIILLLTIAGVVISLSVHTKDINQQQKVAQNETNLRSQAFQSPGVPAVNSPGDLDRATQSLDAINPDDNSSTINQFDSNLSTF